MKNNKILKDAEALIVLLKKYMYHVAECEGVDFIHGYKKDDVFTEEEWAALQKLSDEAFSPQPSTKKEGS